MTSPLRILHVHSSFSPGGKEARAVRLMNAWGQAARHVVLSGVPGALGAREALDPSVQADFPRDHPPLTGSPSLGRYHALARYMVGFDLVLSYNWGAMDAVMTRRLIGGPPLVHHEDGFNADEAKGQKRSRILFRRFALPAAARLAVPSSTLERIALDIWRQPRGRVARIPNGIPVERYGAPTRAIAGLGRHASTLVIGTLAGLRPVKNLPLLVSAFAHALRHTERDLRLCIVGEGEERDSILAMAAREGVTDRVVLPGFLLDPSSYIGHFDIFALSSDSEQFPISVVEAMAAGLPVAATRVGDLPVMLVPENAALLVPPGDAVALGMALSRLVESPDLARGLGEANRLRALVDFSEDAMIGAYRELYSAALGRPSGLS